MTLTIKLGQDIVEAHSHTKISVHMSSSSAVRVLKDRQTDRQTHTQTDPTDSITSTADAGGKNATEAWWKLAMFGRTGASATSVTSLF